MIFKAIQCNCSRAVTTGATRDNYGMMVVTAAQEDCNVFALRRYVKSANLFITCFSVSVTVTCKDQTTSPTFLLSLFYVPCFFACIFVGLLPLVFLFARSPT